MSLTRYLSQAGSQVCQNNFCFWPLFGRGLNSEMSPLCEQQRTSAKATEFMGSRPRFSSFSKAWSDC
jgi:hypothetical protein